MTPSQLESLGQDAGGRSQPDPQSWQVSWTQSQPSRNPSKSRDTKSAESQILALTSIPKLPLRNLSMGLMNARNHPYHNPLSKPQAFAWLRPI
ncbi:hypothetical protein L3X38_032906 [Prunus dulcis]|uniref:Uncharacterized protein n=1 Tax=Prunus dulcis TaxID=3755 RepID=A0AAD4VG34_PRUDU|nr:hypothetical protein L3X38_032906 [Prunus dulcis]